MGAIAVFLAALLDPIRLVIALLVVLFSRQKWIILVAAAISALAIETLLSSTQHTRTWGQGLPVGSIASLVHASLVFLIRARITAKKQTALPPASESDPYRAYAHKPRR